MQSTLQGLPHHVKHSSFRCPGYVTVQNHRSVCTIVGYFIFLICRNKLTLHTSSLVTNTFLAARSRWTNALVERYCIPRATCCEQLSSWSETSDWTIWLRLQQRDRTVTPGNYIVNDQQNTHLLLNKLRYVLRSLLCANSITSIV